MIGQTKLPPASAELLKILLTAPNWVSDAHQTQPKPNQSGPDKLSLLRLTSYPLWVYLDTLSARHVDATLAILVAGFSLKSLLGC